MAHELKYYHGEASNPYREINDQQGLWCQRYNETAAMLWDFEYHWANGWAKYSKLEERTPAYYFEQHQQPQKDFATIQEALQAFSFGAYSGLLNGGSARWVQYVYDHAMLERFYKPIFNVVPAAEIPSYLHWYKGEASNPYQHEPATSTKGFWWDFERNWYVRAEQNSQQAFAEHLHGWFVRCIDTPWHAIPKAEQNKLLAAYKAGTKA